MCSSQVGLAKGKHRTCYVRKLKGNVLTSAYMCGLETMAPTGKQQEKVQVCENNWMRRIVGVKRPDRRKWTN